MEHLGYSGYSLSKALDTSEAVVSNIRNGKNPPNVLLVRALLNKHEELDPDWLLLGKGHMVRTVGGGASVGDAEALPVLRTMNERLERIEQMLQRMAAVQLERDVVVDESISDLDRTVRDLEKELDALKKGPDKRQ